MINYLKKKKRIIYLPCLPTVPEKEIPTLHLEKEEWKLKKKLKKKKNEPKSIPTNEKKLKNDAYKTERYNFTKLFTPIKFKFNIYNLYTILILFTIKFNLYNLLILLILSTILPINLQFIYKKNEDYQFNLLTNHFNICTKLKLCIQNYWHTNEHLNKMAFIILNLTCEINSQGNAFLPCRYELLPLARQYNSQGNAFLHCRYELLPLARQYNSQGNTLLPCRYELLPLARQYKIFSQGNAFLPCRYELLPLAKQYEISSQRNAFLLCIYELPSLAKQNRNSLVRSPPSLTKQVYLYKPSNIKSQYWKNQIIKTYNKIFKIAKTLPSKTITKRYNNKIFYFTTKILNPLGTQNKLYIIAKYSLFRDVVRPGKFGTSCWAHCPTPSPSRTPQPTRPAAAPAHTRPPRPPPRRRPPPPIELRQQILVAPSLPLSL